MGDVGRPGLSSDWWLGQSSFSGNLGLIPGFNGNQEIRGSEERCRLLRCASPVFNGKRLLGELHVKSTKIVAAVRVAVLGEWIPPQLADVLAMQRVEEPETSADLVGRAATEHMRLPDGGDFDFALSTAMFTWCGWACQPLWYDTLAVGVAKRSHLLAYREVPCREALKQPLICAQSTKDESWPEVAQHLFHDVPHERKEPVSTFEMAMTLVSAGYGVNIAPAARLAHYEHRGVAARPLADAPTIVVTYLLRPFTSLSESQERFIQRARRLH